MNRIGQLTSKLQLLWPKNWTTYISNSKECQWLFCIGYSWRSKTAFKRKRIRSSPDHLDSWLPPNAGCKQDSPGTMMALQAWTTTKIFFYVFQIADEESLACKIGFFLHIPFPPWDIVKIFPWVDVILQGILNCDLVGFHISDYCLNFIDCCQRGLGSRVDRRNMLAEFGGHTVRIRELPIGVPFKHFESLAESAPDKSLTKKVQIILGVDRLDYTKGLTNRLLAFERLLDKYPEHREKVMLMQIAVPSRTDVKEYQDLKEDMDKLVGKINGRFSTPHWSPIRYIFGCVEQVCWFK